MSQRIILPIPFAISTYGVNEGDSYKSIIETKMANPTQSNVYSSNQFHTHCTILDPIQFDKIDDNYPEIGNFLESVQSMQTNTARCIQENFNSTNSYLVLGGDHSISIGTGLGLSKCVDMAKVGLIWIDAHGDCNTPETSQSKCITGYPLAVNTGLGPSELTNPFEDNFIKKVVYIGLRDVDEMETNNVTRMQATVFSNIDVEHYGIKSIMDQALDQLQDCTHIWLSIDIDSLDSIYFQPNETDVPVPGGLTPRELLYITSRTQQTGKLLITELTQLNNIGTFTPLIALSSRIGELALGLGRFRYQ